MQKAVIHENEYYRDKKIIMAIAVGYQLFPSWVTQLKPTPMAPFIGYSGWDIYSHFLLWLMCLLHFSIRQNLSVHMR